MDTVSEALKWYDMGVPPIALKPQTKKPMFKWLKWTTCMPMRDDVIKWFTGKNQNNNLAILCGLQKHLVVLDFDNMPSYNKWYARCVTQESKIWKDVAEKSYRVKTPRGMHVYVYTEEEEKTRGLVKENIDIKAGGGFVLVPPSIHPSGIPYTKYSGRKILTVDTTKKIFPEEKVEIEYIQPTIIQKIVDMNVFDAAIELDKKDEKVIKLLSIPILDFVKRYTKMKKTGNEYYMGICFMHKDTDPSLSINTKTNRAKCFSPRCIIHDRSVDIIRMYQLLNGTTFMQSVDDLCSMFGIK